MESRPIQAELGAILRRAVHPPVREGRFWLVQVGVVLIAGLHLLVDVHVHPGVDAAADRAAVIVPVALWIVPVLYSALRYGLVGSAATSVWMVVLWLPDLLLPRGEGDATSDLVNLAVVVIVGIFVGHRIEVERLANALARRATAERLTAEARYRQLFEANRAPTLVLDDRGAVAEANPAARALLGSDLLGRPAAGLLGVPGPLEDRARQVLSLPDGRAYRLELVSLPGNGNDGAAQTQVVLEDVTEERKEGQRATRYAALVVRAEEDQRRRLSRELHDEPLQLFLHLARRLGSLGETPGVPAAVTGGLAEARRQALDAADRLRTMARGLRPPALDQLGLSAALSSLLAEVEEDGGPATELEVTGEETRLAPEVELGAFRIAQEAVHNTVRHAEAARVRVSVGFRPEALVLTVADDGRGFEPSRLDGRAPEHLGLVGMAERARLLGGSLQVRSAPGDGTVVEAGLPLARPSGDGAPRP